MNIQTFPISHLRNFIFCTRIPYFKEVMALTVEAPLWAKKGSEKHEKTLGSVERRKFRLENGEVPSQIRQDYEVFSMNLGLHGAADFIVEFETGFYVGEIKPTLKTTEAGLNYGWILQGYAYGLCAEEALGKPFKGIVFLSHDVSHGRERSKYLFVNEKTKLWAIKKIEEFRRTLMLVTLPASSAQIAQCVQCEYLNFCNDRY